MYLRRSVMYENATFCSPEEPPFMYFMVQFPLKCMTNGTISLLIVYCSFLSAYLILGVHISIYSSHASDFNCRNKALTTKLLKHNYRYHKLRKVFYRDTVG